MLLTILYLLLETSSVRIAPAILIAFLITDAILIQTAIELIDNKMPSAESES